MRLLDQIRLSLHEIWVGFTQRDSFIQNLGIVFSGKTVIFIVGFFLTPIISRIYTPDAYGTFAVFNVMVLNLSLIATLSLPLAMVVTNEEKDFRDLLTASVSTAIFFALLTLGVFALVGNQIFAFFNQPALANYWYLIGLSVMLYSLCTILGNWNIREKAFKRSSAVAISETMGTKLATLAIGLVTQGFRFGLVFGELTGKALNLGMQGVLFVRERINWLKPSNSFKEIYKTVYKFKDYPLFMFPSNWILLLSEQVIILLIANRFGSDFVGSYSMANGLLMVPISLLANSVQPVLMQRVAEKVNRDESIDSIVAKMSNALLYLSVIPFAFLFIWGDLVVRIFLGQNWIVASIIISYLSLLGILKLQSESLSGVLIALKKQKAILILNISRFILISVSLGASLIWFDEFYITLFFFIAGAALANVLWIGYIYKIAGLKAFSILAGPIIFLILIIGIFYLVRIAFGI